MSDSIDVLIGQNVKSAREALGWKQDTLAEHAKLSRPTIGKIESGEQVSLSAISSIADVFGIPPYMLMLRSIDIKKLADMATNQLNCQSMLEKFQASPDRSGADDVMRMEDMSSSPIKDQRQNAHREINKVVAKILGLEFVENNRAFLQMEVSRSAATGIAISRLPTYPIINALIATLILA